MGIQRINFIYREARQPIRPSSFDLSLTPLQGHGTNQRKAPSLSSREMKQSKIVMIFETQLLIPK